MCESSKLKNMKMLNILIHSYFLKIKILNGSSNETAKKLLEWYHNVLYHPGETRTKLIVGQQSYWKVLQKCVHYICSKHYTSHFLKHGKRNYSKLSPKQN